MICYIYDGSKDHLELKSVLEADPSTPLFKSTEQEAYSTIVLVGKDADLCRKFDLIKIETHKMTLWGMLIEPEISDVSDVCETTVALGCDGLLSEAHIDNSSIKNDMAKYIANMFNSCYYITAPMALDLNASSGAGYVIAPDNSLPIAQCLRQLYKQNFEIKYRIGSYMGSGTKLIYTLKKRSNTPTFTINADDTLSYEVEFTKDKVTAVKGWGRQNADAPWINTGNAFVMNDGSVQFFINFPTPTNYYKPVQFENVYIEKEEDEDYGQFQSRLIAEMKNILQNQEYNNSIVIQVDIENWLYKDVFFSSFLPTSDDPFKSIFDAIGISGTFVLKNGEKMKTVLNEIELSENVATLTFGLGNRRLFDRLK